MSALKGTTIRDAFYTRSIEDPSYWICKCGSRRKKTGTGWTNLVTHVLNQHPDEYSSLQNAESKRDTAKRESLPFKFYKRKTINIHGWLKLISSCNQPFNVCEIKQYIDHMKYEKIDVDTLKKYGHELVKTIEQKIKFMLPDKFAIVFDTWTQGTTKYTAVFSSSYADTSKGYETYLLGFSPFLNELSEDADTYITFLKYVLGIFDKSFKNVLSLTADNCNTNKSIAKKLGLKFVGCASHRFDLALKEFIVKEERIIKKVNDVLKKLQLPAMAAKLRVSTPLAPKIICETRWSSVCEVLERYMKIEKFLDDEEFEELEEILLSPREVKKIEKLSLQLSDINTVTKELQDEHTTLSSVRALFDVSMEDYNLSSDYLSPSAKIILHKDYESGIVKIQESRVNEMSESEKEATKELLKKTSEIRVPNENLSLAQRAFKKRRISESSESKYIDVRHILPTSNVCERTFSIAKNVLGERRIAMLPINFEMQMFLELNSSTWSIQDNDNIVNKVVRS